MTADATSGRGSADELIRKLGYADSPNFLRGKKLESASEYAHVFRLARAKCGLQGVYLLRSAPDASRDTSTPVVYVAAAETAEKADEYHRQVWNQDVVPFLIVYTPAGTRLYTGFDYHPAPPRSSVGTGVAQRGVLDTAIAFNDVSTRLAAFRADAIDDGTIWRVHGSNADPARRVDWRLLKNLEQLGRRLRSEGKNEKLDPAVAHALIGKFVYLRYLRDRGILSDRRLADFGIVPARVFGREVKLEALRELVEQVDLWLNGSIFPFPFSGAKAPKVGHIRQVAAVFLGDDAGNDQLHLDFQAYDFSYIPIETLSVIYEQFLHAEGKGASNGAYYTPIPLVNLMLAELDELRHIEARSSVEKPRFLDPSCGSGAFLVQCYRRLIEERIQQNNGQLPRPTELRELLVECIYGLDRDDDACRVAELSLILTMLDYVDPPDLLRTPTFKLPNLHNQNIFESDFFDPESVWRKTAGDAKYDCIVGNPPWIQLHPKVIRKRQRRVAAGEDLEPHPDRHALAWIDEHPTTPVVAYEVAEAFAWEAVNCLSEGGVIGLLLPAMTLFREHQAFRAAFFRTLTVRSVANFANLREVLFAGRSRMPAAAFFYCAAGVSNERTDNCPEPVQVFSPMVANQEANLPAAAGERKETWAITVNRSEVRPIPVSTIAGGANLPWKLAMWGSARDERLLTTLAKRFPTLGAFARKHDLMIRQGLELRDRIAVAAKARAEGREPEPLEPASEVAAKPGLDVEILRKLGRIHVFPTEAVAPVEASRAFVRQGRLNTPLAVCKPPHVVISAARTFAVFSSEFLAIPHPHIGIAGPVSADLLRAMALFLNSDFVVYHQFFASPQEGVRDGRGTLKALLKLPTPLDGLESTALASWGELHQAVVRASQDVLRAGPRTPDLALDGTDAHAVLDDLENQLNDHVAKLLRLSRAQRWLVHDLVHVRMHLSDGQFGANAVRAPTRLELEDYARALALELDGYLAPDRPYVHHVAVVFGRASGMVQIELGPPRSERVQVNPAEGETEREFERMRVNLDRRKGQWLYFERNLLLHHDHKHFFFKPMQRLWWTQSQGLLDADLVREDALALLRENA